MYSPENIPPSHVVNYKGQIFPEPVKTFGKPEFMAQVEHYRKIAKTLLVLKGI